MTDEWIVIWIHAYERRACISLKFIDKDLILSKILIIPTGKRRMFWNIICVLDCSFIIRWNSPERLQNTHLFVEYYFIHSFTTCMKDLKILLKDPGRSFITVYCFTHANSFLNYFLTHPKILWGYKWWWCCCGEIRLVVDGGILIVCTVVA